MKILSVPLLFGCLYAGSQALQAGEPPKVTKAAIPGYPGLPSRAEGEVDVGVGKDGWLVSAKASIGPESLESWAEAAAREWRVELKQPERISFCELVANPAKFDGHLVTFRASFRRGFEIQELYCVSCQGDARVWLEFPGEPPKALAWALRRLPSQWRTINATFSGVFRSNGSAFGHLNSYSCQFDLSGLADVELVSKSYAVPDALPVAERGLLCQCELP